MKISLKLLTVYVLISAVNVNATHYVENITGLQTEYNTELQKELSINDNFFEEIHNKYWLARKSDNIENQQEQLDKFYEALFGSNGDNLEKILHCSDKELDNIEQMLSSQNTMEYLKKIDKYSLYNLSNKANNMKSSNKYKYHDTRYFRDVINRINNYINILNLMPSLGMKWSFSELWNKQAYLLLYDKNTAFKIKKEQIETCVEYLLGDGCNNLQTILFTNDINLELNCIWDLLRQDYAKKYLLQLLDNDNNLLNTLSDIVNNTKTSNYYINDVINQIKTVILMKKLGIEISFEKIFDDYNNAIEDNDKEEQHKQIKKFCDYLFGNDVSNLKDILFWPDRLELYDINKMLDKNDVKKYLVKFLKNKRNKINDIIENITYSNNKITKCCQEKKMTRKIKDLCKLIDINK